MAKVNTELKKQENFRQLMYSFDWINCLEEQLANNFTDEEAVQYIEFVIEHLTPEYKNQYLENVYNDNSIHGEISVRDYASGNEFSDLIAHERFYNQTKNDLENLIPLLIKKKEEKRLDVKLLEKAEREKKTNKKYGYTGLKLLVEHNFNEVTDEFHKILKEYELISKESSLADFRRIFRGVDIEIPLDNRVIWLKSVPALKYLIEKLSDENLIEQLPKQGHWKILANCFCNSDKQSYKPNNLKNNTQPLTKDSEDNINKALKELYHFMI